MWQTTAFAADGVNFLLTVSKTGSGTGVVTSADGNINCGTTCSFNYASGATVTLNAVPDAQMGFIGWSGAGCTGSGPCVVTMDAAKTVTAEFQALRTLTVIKAGVGTGRVSSTPFGIDCGVICSTFFVNNTVVTLTPIADSGWFFTGWTGVCNGKGATCQVTMDQSKTVTATFGPIRKDSLVFDFNNSGIWMVTSSLGSTWSQLAPWSSNQLAVANLNGTPTWDLVAISPSNGLWAWMDRTPGNWVNLHPQSPLSVAAADMNGDGRDELAVNFGTGGGLWSYSQLPVTVWSQMNASPAKSITPAYLTENNLQSLVVDFAPNGLWKWLNNNAWSLIDIALSPTASATGDLDGNGHEDVVFSFGPSGGLWAYMNSSFWTQLHPLSPLAVTACDLDGNGKSDLAINFGPTYGLWRYLNNDPSTWAQWQGVPATSVMACANLDNNATQELVADFAPYGIYSWNNNAAWALIVGQPASKQIVALPEAALTD